MAMAAKEDMEITVCPSSNTKPYYDYDCVKCAQTVEESEPPEHRNDDDTKRFSTNSYTQQASCSYCEKDDPVVAFCHTCESSLCTFCYDCHIRQTQYKKHNVVNFEHKVTECPEQGNRLSIGYDRIQETSQLQLQLIPLQIIKIEEQLSKFCSELNQVRRKLAMEAEKANDGIDQLYTEQIQKLKQQKEQKMEQLLDAALELENKNLTKLKDVESIQQQLQSLKKSPNFAQVATELEKVKERCKTVMAQPILIPSLEFRTSDAQMFSLGDVICTDSAAKEDKDTNNARHESGNRASARPRSNNAFKLPAMKIKIRRNKSDASIKRPSRRYMRDASTYHIKLIQWPTRIKTNGGKMGRMHGIAFSKTSIWAIADYSNHCVHICDASNELIKIIGDKGSGKDQFNHPVGVTFDSEGCLYVSEYGNHRVQKFDANFKYMLQFGDEGEDGGQLNHPMGIIAYKDKVYVADSANSRIAVFYTHGEFCCNIVGGDLRDPLDIAINTTNKQLLVTDSACCIRIYSLDGKYINRFSALGADRGLLNHPAGLAIDSNGFVFVADTYNHRVCVFDNNGMFIHSFGSCGRNEGQFNRPCGIAFSNNGNLHISDYGNQRVVIFPTNFKTGRTKRASYQF